MSTSALRIIYDNLNVILQGVLAFIYSCSHACMIEIKCTIIKRSRRITIGSNVKGLSSDNPDMAISVFILYLKFSNSDTNNTLFILNIDNINIFYYVNISD